MTEQPLLTKAIPAELRKLRQWVGYRAVLRDGRWTKVPTRCDGRGRASVSDPATWSTFERSLATVELGQVDGIGFVFTANDPYAGVDLDDCIDAGWLHPAAAVVVDQLSSYTERSPSGRGLHAIVRARHDGSRYRTNETSWGGRLELYDRRRFFTCTGLRLSGTPGTIEGRQDELDAVVAEFLTPPPPADRGPGRPLPAFDLDDDRLLEKARRAKNGQRFGRLWDGDSSGYDSQSEADLALCGILAFWTGGDANRIDRLFRQSNLFRDKWIQDRGDSLTYGDQTIAKAIDGCPAFYTSREAGLRAILEAATAEEAEALARRRLS